MWSKCFSIIFLLVSYTVSAQQQTTVNFPFDKEELTVDARLILDSLGANNNIDIEIYGHCDQLGSRNYNYRLSVRRANAVKEYLVSRGFNAINIKTIKGLGKEEPVINKLDAISRKANRRVTIHSIDFIKPSVPDSPATDTSSLSNKAPRAPLLTKEKLVDIISDTIVRAGENIILKNINFFGGLHRFLPGSSPALQDLLEAMQQIPTLVIEIEGHVCCRPDGSDGIDNETGEPFLSYNRAKAVYEFLITKGIDKDRMTYKGYGGQYPMYVYESSEAERTANRRVEIKIVKK